MAAQGLEAFMPIRSSRIALRRLSHRLLFVVCALILVVLLLLAIQIDEEYIPVLRISPATSSPRPTDKKASEAKIWEAPKVDPIVHGVHVSEAVNAEPLYQLIPFDLAPAVAPPKDKHAPWLAAVICAPWDAGRRMMIRSSWMRLYQDVPFDGRFIISNPGPQWTEIVRQENRTFGDMIVLDTLQEDDFTANTVKTLGFYKWLLEKSPRKYEFVSKMDTDLWLNARGFWDRFLHPRLADHDGSPRATVNRTIFGQLYYSPPHEVVFPHGSMYTVTWDMVELLVSLQRKYNVVAGEDLAVAVLMLKGKEKATVVNFNGTEKFDFDERDMRSENSAWALPTTIPSAAEHALYGRDVIAVHQLKSDQLWLKVADCFDEKGIKKMPPEEKPDEVISEEKDGEESKSDDEKKEPMSYSQSRFEAIPEDYWEMRDKVWLCNGIWQLEPGKDRNPDIS